MSLWIHPNSCTYDRAWFWLVRVSTASHMPAQHTRILIEWIVQWLRFDPQWRASWTLKHRHTVVKRKIAQFIHAWLMQNKTPVIHIYSHSTPNKHNECGGSMQNKSIHSHIQSITSSAEPMQHSKMSYSNGAKMRKYMHFKFSGNPNANQLGVELQSNPCKLAGHTHPDWELLAVASKALHNVWMCACLEHT